MAWWDDLLESAKKTIEGWSEPSYKPKTTTTPSTYTGQVGGITKAATPQPTYQPKQTTPTPPAAAEPANWWEKTVEPWWEETAKPWLGETFGQDVTTPQPTLGGAGLAEPPTGYDPRQALGKVAEDWKKTMAGVVAGEVPSAGVPELPTLPPGPVTPIPPTWPETPIPGPEPGEGGLPGLPGSDQGVPPPDEMWGPGNYDPQAVQWLYGLGYSQQDIAGMTIQDLQRIAQEETEKQWIEERKRYQEWEKGPESAEHREWERERARKEYFSPESIAHRTAQWEEAQGRSEQERQRYLQRYWSPKEVEQRRKAFEESAEWQRNKQLEGWEGYFDTLEDMELSPDANEFWANPAQFAELRRRWEAAGKKTSWRQFLKSYKFKDEFASRTYRERMGRAAKFAPRQRGVSF